VTRASSRIACRPGAAALRISVFSALSFVSLACARDALANGAFPSSGQIVIDPTDPARVGIRTTYGVVTTADAGATFHWSCEAALGYGSASHPQLGVTDQGTVFGGLLDGMIRGRLGACSWERIASLEGLAVADVSFSSQSGRAIAAVVPAPDARGEVWRSDDDAATWSKLGASLPVKFRPLTLDAAPSDPDRLYVSGLVDGSQVRGGVATSRDGGETWSLAFVPDADASKAPYIGGVDPVDPDVLWVRLDAAPGELLVSRDGGDTWELALLVDGFLRAFALSPDGSEVIAGGDVDGLARADSVSLDWAKVSTVAARCAKWRGDVIDVCGTEAIDGFTMGRSTDDGATFEPYFAQACLVGPEPCDEATPVGACAASWPAVREQIGAVGCGAGGGGATSSAASASAGPSSSSGPATGSGPGATGASNGAGVDSAAGGTSSGDGEGADDPDAGCSCRSTPGHEAASIAPLIGMACAAWGAVRARSRIATPPRPGKRRR
jgi:hypothetical protein